VSSYRSSDFSAAAENAWLASRGLQETYGEQGQERQCGLQTHNAISRFALRQHAVTRTSVVLAVHPGDCHEMRELS